MKIRHAQNVSRVLSSRKKYLLTLLDSLLGSFQETVSMDRNYAKIKLCFAIFPWWANGCQLPSLGSCAGVIHLRQ